METNKDFRQDEELEIDLLELLHVLGRKWLLLVAALILGVLLAGVGTKFLITPQYKASSMIYILTKTTSVTSLADLQIGSQLTVDFEILAKSRPVIDRVRENLHMEEISYESFSELVNISTPSNSRILQITVTHPDPKTAMEIANAMADSVADRVAEIMVTDRPTIAEQAVVPVNPASPNLVKNALIGGLLFLVATAAIVIVRYLLDDTIKTEEDVERYLGLNTLAAFAKVSQEGSESGKKKHRAA